MSNKNKLSIYLIKKEINSVKKIFKNFDEIKELKKYNDNSIVYYLPSHVHEPYWLKSFFNDDGKGFIKQSNARVVLIKKISFKQEERFFALTFGYSKYMFKDDVLEEQFGLKIILNSIDDDQIRRISKTSVGSNLKQSNEQLPKSSNISEFGFDVNRDLMKNVSGKSEDEMFEKCILTGGDVLSVNVERDINNIDEFLKFCYERFNEKKYLRNFSWVDNIKFVKNKGLIAELNKKLIELINYKSFNQVWMAVPEVVNWEDIKDFKVSGLEEGINDIYIDKVVGTFKSNLVDVEQLKSKRIVARSSKDEHQNIYEWNSYKCIIAEIELNGQAYCLNDGKWYIINQDFVTDINIRYSNIELLNEDLIDFSESNHANEDDYNTALADSLDNAVLIHKYKISIGGGSENNIEPCDVFWNNKFIHVKRNSGSSDLSHLFNQALVSSQVLLDAASRNQFRDKLAADGKPNIIPEPFQSNNYDIVIAIINKFQDNTPKIPFFSKVSICFATSNIQNYGYRVKLKNIKII